MRWSRFALIGVFLLALFAMLGVTAIGQSTAQVGSIVAALADPIPEARSRAFYQLIKPFYGPGGADTETAVARLLKAYPAQADTIKLALFDALERESVLSTRLEEEGQQLTEDLVNYEEDLGRATGSLRDLRALRGLLAAQRTGGGIDPEYLADLCPSAAEAIIAQIHQPERIWRGSSLHIHARAVGALGECLKRASALSARPDVMPKIRSELIAALNHPDSGARQAALEGLFPLRNEPEIRAKLELLAISDPYVGPPHRNEARGRYWLREQATRIVRPPDGDKAYFVMRSPDSHECRVQEQAERALGQRYIGPFLKAESAESSLCKHVDTITLNPSLCWRTVPNDACAK